MRILDNNLLKQNIETRIKSDLENNNINSACVLVNQNGKQVYKNYFGSAQENSIFRLASMTKPITAVAVMTLYDKGLIDLEDSIEMFLPQFSDVRLAKISSENTVSKGDVIKGKLTIKHLLTHTSGILNGKSGEIYKSCITEEENSTLEKTVDFYANCGLEFEPFSHQEYNATAAFDLLARIVEVVSGMDYNDYLTENIFKPLGMKNTTFVPSSEQWQRIIPMHNKVDGKSVLGITYPDCVFEKTPITHYLGGAGLISTLEDYSAFAEMLLNFGEFGGKRIISPKAVKLISTPHVPQEIMPGRERWGLGVRVIAREDYKLPVGTFGLSGAYGTHFWVDTENKITAVYLKNSRFDGGSGAVTADNFEQDVFNSLI